VKVSKLESFNIYAASAKWLKTTFKLKNSHVILNTLKLEEQDSIPGGGRDSSLQHRVQTACAAHPAYPMSTGDYFPRIKRREREDDHSYPSSAKAKNM
jgi:hypothetical protein